MLELVHLFDKLKQVRAFVFDVDGVFTNNDCLITESGEMLRTMSFRDGLVVKMAVQAGYPMCVITGGRSLGVTKRFHYLGIEEVYSGISDKFAALQVFLEKTGIPLADVLYLGDDLPDIPVLKRVGIAAAPADAIPEVLAIADYISPFAGGKGCVRDVIEKVMKLQGKWEGALEVVAHVTNG